MQPIIQQSYQIIALIDREKFIWILFAYFYLLLIQTLNNHLCNSYFDLKIKSKVENYTTI